MKSEHHCLCTAPMVVKVGWGWEVLTHLGQNLALRFAGYQTCSLFCIKSISEMGKYIMY